MKHWLLLACLASQAACVRAPPETPRAAFTPIASLVPAQARASDWPAPDWWTALGDPALDAAIRGALAENPGMQIASARLAEATALTDLRAAERWPLLKADASVTGQRYSENSTQAKLAGESFTLATLNPVNATWHVDLWGKDRAALAAAQGEARAQAADRRMAGMLLAAAMSRSWLRLALVDAALALAEDLRANLETQRRVLSTRQRLGLDPARPLEAHRAARKDVDMRLSALKLQQSILHHQLAALRGRPFTAEPARALRTRHFELPAALPLHLLARRPDIEAAREHALAAARHIDIARAAFYPDINLRALVGFQGLGFMHALLLPERLAAIAGPSVELPLFDGGRLEAQLDYRHAAYDEAVAQYNARLVEAVRAAADALARFEEAAGRERDQAEVVAAAGRQRDLAASNRRTGLSTALPLLESEFQLGTARLAATAAAGDVAASYVDVVETLGGGDAFHSDPIL